jgi:hypothetical protein
VSRLLDGRARHTPPAARSQADEAGLGAENGADDRHDHDERGAENEHERLRTEELW